MLIAGSVGLLTAIAFLLFALIDLVLAPDAVARQLREALLG